MDWPLSRINKSDSADVCPEIRNGGPLSRTNAHFDRCVNTRMRNTEMKAIVTIERVMALTVGTDPIGDRNAACMIDAVQQD